MSNPGHGVHEEEVDDQGEVYIDEVDIINEVDVDEEDLSDADDEVIDEVDDSMHIFTGHTVVCSPTYPVLVAIGVEMTESFFGRLDKEIGLLSSKV